MISVIIPTLNYRRSKNLKKIYKSRLTLSECLDALKDNVKEKMEVIVVSNNIDDKKLTSLIKRHPRVDKYCFNSVNIGVSRSWNLGAQLAEGDALFFLNDDCFVGNGGIEKLYQELQKVSVGITGVQGIKWGKIAPKEHLDDLVCPTSVDAVNGFAFMIRTNLFRELGGFDINYSPAFFEEIDMCFKVKDAGYKIVAVPFTAIRHFQDHGVSSRHSKIYYLNKSIDSIDLTNRNQKYFVEKWYPDNLDMI